MAAINPIKFTASKDIHVKVTPSRDPRNPKNTLLTAALRRGAEEVGQIVFVMTPDFHGKPIVMETILPSEFAEIKRTLQAELAVQPLFPTETPKGIE